MDTRKVRMLKEDAKSYTMHDGQSPFTVAKAGLSEDMHKRIKGYADGGSVEAGYTPPMDEPFIRGEVVGKTVDANGNVTPVSRGGPLPPMPDSGIQVEYPQGSGKFVTLQQGLPVDGVTATTRAPEPGPVEPKPYTGPPEQGIGSKLSSLFRTGGMSTDMTDEKIDASRMKAAADQKGLGIVPRGTETAPAPVAAPPPAVAPKRSGSGGFGYSSPGDSDIAKGFDAQQHALAAETAAKQAQAAQTVDVLDATHRRMEQVELERKQRSEQARQETEAIMAKHQAAVDEMKNINTTVDPGRYWATRSTGQKILGVIGLALGALGAGRDGINKSAVMMNQAIDRDLEAQKAEYQLALQKGRAAVEGLQSQYAQARNLFQDDAAAMSAAKASALDLADNDLKRVSAGAQGPQAAAQAQMMSAQLQSMKGKAMNDAANTTFDNRVKGAVAGAQINHLNAEAAHQLGAGAKTSQAAGLAEGAHRAAQELENELKRNPTSSEIPRMRASLMLHLNKLQGGRFNEEIHAMNNALVPGNEGQSLVERGKSLADPNWMRKDFEILHHHIDETAAAPPNPAYSGDQ